MGAILLAAVALLATSGCGHGSAPGGPHLVEVGAASGPAETRLACNRGSQAPPPCRLRLYEIMVEAFIDGDPNANFNVGYGPSPHRGDLQGIIESLDDIQGLGANTLWLTPIFASAAESGQPLSIDRLDATGYPRATTSRSTRISARGRRRRRSSTRRTGAGSTSSSMASSATTRTTSPHRPTG